MNTKKCKKKKGNNEDNKQDTDLGKRYNEREKPSPPQKKKGERR